MNFNEYQHKARDTAVYPTVHAIVYPALGLAGEAGEVANKIKKVLREDQVRDDQTEAVSRELGDCLWYIANLAYDMGISLDDIAVDNLNELKDRQARGVLKGSGDKR